MSGNLTFHDVAVGSKVESQVEGN